MKVGGHIRFVLRVCSLTKALGHWHIECLSDSRCHTCGAGETFVRILRKCLQYNQSQSSGETWIDKSGRSGCDVEVLREHIHRCITPERRHASHHFIQYDPKRVNVAAFITRIPSYLLG